MVRTKEGGSVLGFVLIGVVLVALFLGGVYFVRQQTGQPPETTQPQPVPQEIPGPQPNGEQPQPTESAPSTDTQNTQGHLPQSGPREAISTALAMGAIAGVGLAYVRSRRVQTSL